MASRRAETRIGDDARAAATSRLDAALREGRFDLAEYERRLMVVQAAKVRKDLTPAVADLPVHSGQTTPELRISTADREHALVRLTEALTDGRLEAAAYAGAEELLHRVVTYADLDAVVGNLDAKASLVERDQAIARIEAAAAAGLLEPTERDNRVAAARSATTDAQLAALVADLTASGGRAPLRVSNADREAVAARLQEAVEAGLIDLTEFDERVRAVYAARLRDELTRLEADLPKPAPPPAPPAVIPPRRPRSVKSTYVTTYLTTYVTDFGGTLAVLVVAIAMGIAGLGVFSALLGAAWVIFMVWLAFRTRRAVADAMTEEFGPREVKRIPRAADSVSGFFARSSVAREDKLRGHKRYIEALTCLVLPDGTPLAISGAQDNTAMVWDLANHTLLHTLSGHTNDVTGVAAVLMPDGSPVAVTASRDGTVRLWDLHDGSQRATLPRVARDTRKVACLTLPDGTPVAVTHNLMVVQVWDLAEVRLRHRFEVEIFIDALAPVVLPDGTLAAVMAGTSDYAVVLVDLMNGKRKTRLRGHKDLLTAVDTAVLPDGTPIAVSASEDKTVRVWDLDKGTRLHTIAGMLSAKQAVVCSSLPDGTPIVAASGDENTHVWDLRNGAELRTLDVHGTPIAAAATPDQTLFLGATGDGSLLTVRRLT